MSTSSNDIKENSEFYPICSKNNTQKIESHKDEKYNLGDIVPTSHPSNMRQFLSCRVLASKQGTSKFISLHFSLV